MYETRWIGIVGSIVVLFAAASELYGIHSAVSLAEGPFQADLTEHVTKLVSILTLIAVSFTVRLILLVVCKAGKHVLLVFSWLLSVALIASYVLAFADPVPVQSYSGFTIYHSTKTDWAALTGMMFIILGFIRFLVTAGFAWDRSRIK